MTNRNALCPCGSGKKYKRCHEPMATASPVPSVSVLVDRREADPTVLVRGPTDLVGTFVVALAAIFNDLKDVATFEQPMLPSRPAADDVSAAAGEWRGRHTLIHRLIAGMLSELMQLLDEKRAILNETEVQRAVAALPSESRESWDAVVAVALKVDANKTALRRMFAYIRNNVSFHYTALTEIGEGWKKVFVDDPKVATNRAAVYSLGDSMETTRFHFADAAFQAAMHRGGERLVGKATNDAERIDARVLEMAKAVNLALRFLIEYVVSDRQGKATLPVGS